MKEFISEKEVLDIWDIKVSNMTKEETFNIYIDNPFCVQECSYCKHTGSLIRKNLEDFQKYYNIILPKQIKKFSRILKKRIPDTIYFGGGTPSAISSSQMKSLFGSIENFQRIPNKVFECNPNLLNDKKIELLIENKFSYVSLGIQSLEEKVLKNNKRKGYKEIPLKKYIADFKKGGVLVSCDLMAFIGEEKDSFREILRVERDIISLIKNYKPDMITVYPESNFLKKDVMRGIKMSKYLRKMILEISKKYNLNHYNYHLSIDDEKIMQEMDTCYHFGIISSEKMYKAKQYDSSGPPRQNNIQNCLALGGFKHHRPYSYQGDDFVYYNLNDKNKGFSYFATKMSKSKKGMFNNINFI